MSGVAAWGKVVAREDLGRLVWLTLAVPGWPGADPGQFAMLRAEESRCFLARPLSIADEEQGQVSFLIAPVGQGTLELCRLRSGESVWVVGPLGRGFEAEAMLLLASEGSRLVLVGGGVGVAPFPLLLRRLAERAGGKVGSEAGSGTRGGAALPVAEVLVLLGFRDAKQARGAEPIQRAVEALARAGVECRAEVTTEDGSVGQKGLVSQLLAQETRPGDCLAVCGPWAMTEAVAALCRCAPGIRAWFSLETKMACGVGACHGCVVELNDGTFARVCRDGPVFPGEVLFGAPGTPASGSHMRWSGSAGEGGACQA